jgi:hypothetical protein
MPHYSRHYTPLVVDAVTTWYQMSTPTHQRPCPLWTIGCPTPPPIVGSRPTSPTPSTPSWRSSHRSTAALTFRARHHRSPIPARRALAVLAKSAPAIAVAPGALLTDHTGPTTTATLMPFSATPSTSPSSAFLATTAPPTRCHG